MSNRLRKFLSYFLMLSMVLSLTAALALVDGAVPAKAAEKTYTFTDRNGKEVTVPVSAFASSVVSFQHGDPWMDDELHMDPSIALGIPDYVEVGSNSTGDLCMGANGVLVLQFDRYITDGEGDDVYVFEVGGYVEETKVEVSADLKKWYEIGYVRGYEAGLDLNGKVPEGSSFKYVRLTDTGNNPNGDWPGADIDAVCGLHTTTKATTTVKTPGKTKISKLSSKSGNLTVKYKKVSKNRKGYEIEIATDKYFLNPTSKTSTKTKVTFKKLTKGKTYYVRVRAYNKVDGKKVYGEWSAVKSITIK